MVCRWQVPIWIRSECCSHLTKKHLHQRLYCGPLVHIASLVWKGEIEEEIESFGSIVRSVDSRTDTSTERTRDSSHFEVARSLIRQRQTVLATETDRYYPH